MYRIDSASAAAVLPASTAAGPNPDSYFTKGDPSLAVPATVVEDEYLNMIQEELANVIVGTGAALDKANRAQLLAAIQTLVVNAAVPVGTPIWVPGTTLPTGFLKVNGALLNRVTYANLWAYAQASGNLVTEAVWSATNWGAFSDGDLATTFRLPDARGEFLRAWDDARGVDSGRAIGTSQADQNRSHAHSYTLSASLVGGFVPSGSGGAWLSTAGATTGTEGGSEARPRNIAWMLAIKF